MSYEDVVPKLPAHADPEEYEPEAGGLLRRWRLKLGFDDLADLGRAIGLYESTLREIEEGIRPVKRRYLYQQIGGRMRTAAERRDRRARMRVEDTERMDRIHDQAMGLGRQIAAEIWRVAGDFDAVTLIISVENRIDQSFWTPPVQRLALQYALGDLAFAMARRYPVRDQFILREHLPLGEMIP